MNEWLVFVITYYASTLIHTSDTCSSGINYEMNCFVIDCIFLYQNEWMTLFQIWATFGI
jgi:hypothetical protein